MRLESGNRLLTHFGFLLKVEFVDLLQLALQSEEEGGLVGLQGGLRVLEGQAVGLGLLGGEDGGFAQVLDELFGGVSGNRGCRCWVCWKNSHLFEGLVVDKTSCILWYVELSLLDVLAELPAMLVVSRVATAWRYCGSAEKRRTWWAASGLFRSQLLRSDRTRSSILIPKTRFRRLVLGSGGWRQSRHCWTRAI
jgi:hypothetical protein